MPGEISGRWYVSSQEKLLEGDMSTPRAQTVLLLCFEEHQFPTGQSLSVS